MDEISKKILDIFREISRIPRESKHEEKISAWLVKWAEKHALYVETDAVMNVLIRVPATPGFEERPVVVLQGHMDMVCEKTDDSAHDFSRDPIEFVYDGDWLHADRTTLGADNGVALAYALAVVELNVPHPELELLFTVDEETGLTGASAVKPGTLRGKILLNIDSDDEGIFTIGCCGGVDTKIWFPLNHEPLHEDDECYVLRIAGCQGGHSGTDIVKHRANANKLLVRTLWALREALPLRLIDMHGGTAHNAIPRDARATVALPADTRERAAEIAEKMAETFRNEYKTVEKHIRAELKPAEYREQGITDVLAERILRFMLAFPSGIEELDPSVYHGNKLIAETSNNFAVIRTEENAVRILSSQRSQVMSSRDMMTQKIEMLAHLAGAEYKSGNGYASWQPDWDSRLLAVARDVYEKHFGTAPKVNIVHGGLECGVLGSKHEGMDMISFGPTIENAHSPDEKLYIPSVVKVWEFLTELLKALK